MRITFSNGESKRINEENIAKTEWNNAEERLVLTMVAGEVFTFILKNVREVKTGEKPPVQQEK